ncbi:MAG: FmdB family zinc ribbon protein [Phycisphaerales bacterium]
MPTYDYRCNACGHAFELFQSMTAPVQRKCPACGKLKLERLIGMGAGVIFKGGGFYETDYRTEAYTKSAEAEKKAAEGKPAETKSETPTDATPKPEAGRGAGTADATPASPSKPSNDGAAAPPRSAPQSRTTSIGSAASRKPAPGAKPAKNTRARRAGR